MTFIEKFEALNKKYGKIDESKLTENFAVQVELTDEDCGGIFYVAYANGKPFEVQPYDYHDNTASIKVSSKVLENILSGKSDAVAQYLTGKLKVEGNLGHAVMLVDLMKKEPVKRAKKVAEEKPAKKKTAKKAKE
ncbi:MAG: SCP2 sterol-binding domain-containing protein [Clostridia bacterium]|nr:SCP2 sterol-binding domain-containing protein [Clostridia bacterium]